MNYREVYYLDSAEKRWPKTEYVVEATNEETHRIWSDVHATVRWEQCHGYWYTLAEVYVGREPDKLEKMPVTISVTWNLLDGHLVAFYEATSQVVDHRIVKDHVRSKCSKHTDATNFHHCMHDLGLKYPERRDR